MVFCFCRGSSPLFARRLRGHLSGVDLFTFPVAYAGIKPIGDGQAVGFLGVKPKFQHTGAAAALYVEHFDVAERHKHIHSGEMGWILETNRAMNRGMEAMNGRIVKKYRVYGRDL